MDALLEHVSVNALWTTLLIVHGLVAVALLGALTHQAMAALAPVRGLANGESFVARFRSVSGPRYANAVCVLWILSVVLGGWLYAKYRIQVRIPIEAEGFYKTLGAFELKEHLSVIGLGLLPVYRYLWREDRGSENASARKWITVWLAASCWYAFLAGHVVNNVRGYGG